RRLTHLSELQASGGEAGETRAQLGNCLWLSLPVKVPVPLYICWGLDCAQEADGRHMTRPVLRAPEGWRKSWVQEEGRERERGREEDRQQGREQGKRKRKREGRREKQEEGRKDGWMDDEKGRKE
ncbi:Zinc finger CCCH domain-containing protein 18, partial [Ophiophagus hannah]